ncbi:hypothetical protein CC79DRAFT_1365472 [Sarocladium strictum]
MDRLPTELLYAIVQQLSDPLDAEALAALRGTNRKFRDVVFQGWMKPMLEKEVDRCFLPEAIALHKLPPHYLKAHGPGMKNKNRATIRMPQFDDVNDNTMSNLSVHAALALVKFHKEHLMPWAAIVIDVYVRHCIPLQEPGFPDEVSLDDEVIKTASATYRVEHYLRALVCAATQGYNNESRFYFTERLGLEFDGHKMDQDTVLRDFSAYTPR